MMVRQIDYKCVDGDGKYGRGWVGWCQKWHNCSQSLGSRYCIAESTLTGLLDEDSQQDATLSRGTFPSHVPSCHIHLPTVNLGDLTAFIFLGSKITADGDCSHEIKRHLLLGRKAMTNLDSVLKSRVITLLTKFCIVLAMVFPSSHVWMWELDCKEDWGLKNWCFQTMVLEKTLQGPLGCKGDPTSQS